MIKQKFSSSIERSGTRVSRESVSQKSKQSFKAKIAGVIFGWILSASPAFSKADDTLNTSMNDAKEVSETIIDTGAFFMQWQNQSKIVAFPRIMKTVRDVRLETAPRLMNILKTKKLSEAEQFQKVLEMAAENCGYDPVIFENLIIRESHGDSRVVSSHKARGLTQTTPIFYADMLQSSPRGYVFYGPKLDFITIDFVKEIPDKELRLVLMKYLASRRSKAEYTNLALYLTKHPENTYVSLILGILCLESFKSAAKNKKKGELLTSVKEKLRKITTTPAVFSKIMSQRATKGMPKFSVAELKKAISKVEYDDAVLIQTLQGYGGGGITYAISIGALDHLVIAG